MVLGCGGLATSYPKVYGFIAASARQAQEQSAKEKTRLEVHRVRGKHCAPAESNQESRQPLHFRFQISCALEIKCRWSQVVLVAGRWSLVAGKYWYWSQVVLVALCFALCLHFYSHFAYDAWITCDGVRVGLFLCDGRSFSKIGLPIRSSYLASMY